MFDTRSFVSYVMLCRYGMDPALLLRRAINQAKDVGTITTTTHFYTTANKLAR